MSKTIIFNPTTGEVVYYGGRPKEPLTPKKQALLDGGFELVEVEGDIPSSDRAYVRLDGTKLALKSRAEIDAINQEREDAQKEAGLLKLREQLAELGVAVQ